MHISFIINKVKDYIRKRKLNFLLSLIILTVSLYLLTMVVQMFFNSNYYIYATKKALQNENVVNINVLMDGMDSDYCELVKKLDLELSKEYGDDYGKFMYMDSFYDTSDGREETVSTLYLDHSIMDLCKLPLENANKENGEDDGTILKGYVGAGLKDQYPIGTILTDKHTGSQIEIVAEIETGAVWLPNILLASQNAVVSLDDYIVTEMDTGYFEISSNFYSNTMNSMYIKCKSEDDAKKVKGNVKEVANEMGAMAYCYTLDELIQQEKMETKAFAKEMGFLIVFVVVIATCAYLSAGLADIYSRHYELAVMYINHVSSADMFLMLLAENIIKSVIAVVISMTLYGRDLADTQLTVFRISVVPTVVCSVFVFMLMVTIICYKTINKKKLLSMIGGVRL